MNLVITDAAAAHYPLAFLGLAIEPYSRLIAAVLGVAAAAVIIHCIFGEKPLRDAVIGVAVASAVVALLGLLQTHARDARLFSVESVALGEVEGVNVSGGGCTPVRTSFTLNDGRGISVDGRLSAVQLGSQLFAKTITIRGESKLFVCSESTSPSTCAPQS